MIEDLKQKKDRRKNVLTRSVCILIAIANIAMAVVRPVINYLSGKYENPKNDDGINR